MTLGVEPELLSSRLEPVLPPRSRRLERWFPLATLVVVLVAAVALGAVVGHRRPAGGYIPPTLGGIALSTDQQLQGEAANLKQLAGNYPGGPVVVGAYGTWHPGPGVILVVLPFLDTSGANVEAMAATTGDTVVRRGADVCVETPALIICLRSSAKHSVLVALYNGKDVGQAAALTDEAFGQQ